MKYIKFIFILLVIGMFSCDKKSPDYGIPLCEEPPNVLVDLFSFGIRDKINTNQSVVGKYEADSIKLCNQDLSLNASFEVRSSRLYFNYISFPEDSTAYSQVISKQFFLHLDSVDVDTIKTDFKLTYIKECLVTQFDYLKVYYNDSLYYTNSGIEGYPYLSFLKS